MTATSTSTKRTTARTEAEPISRRPFRSVVINSIMRTTGETRVHAEEYLRWIENVVAAARKNGYKPHYVSQRHLDNHIHKMMAAISPDKALSAPGSTHELIENFVLDRSRGEATLMHDQVYDHGTHCTVLVKTDVFS